MGDLNFIGKKTHLNPQTHYLIFLYTLKVLKISASLTRKLTHFKDEDSGELCTLISYELRHSSASFLAQLCRCIHNSPARFPTDPWNETEIHITCSRLCYFAFLVHLPSK